MYSHYTTLLQLLSIGIPYDTAMMIDEKETKMILEINAEMNKVQGEKIA